MTPRLLKLPLLAALCLGAASASAQTTCAALAPPSEAALFGQPQAACTTPSVPWDGTSVLVLRADRPGQPRPRLSFWRDLAGVARLLEGSAGPTSPQFLETQGSRLAAPLALPLLTQAEVSLTGRQVRVLQVLVPYLPAATGRWQTATGGLDRPRPLMLVDTSGSTLRFLPALTEAVARGLSRAGAGDVEVDVIRLGDGGRASLPARRSLIAALSQLPDLHDIDAAGALALLEPTRPRGVLAMLGGDMALPTDATIAQADPILAAQLTPELDPELSASLSAVSRDTAQMIAFDAAPDQAGAIVAALVGHDAFRSGRAAARDAETVLDAALGAAGWPALVPQDGQAWPDTALADTGAARWSAIPLWLVYNPLMMDVDVLAD